MSTYVVQLDFQDGVGWRDVTSLVLAKTFKRSRNIHNKLKPAQNTCTFEMVDDATIRNLLLTNTLGVLINITKDTVDYFTGKVRTTFDVIIESDVKVYKIEAEDNGYRLKKKLTTDIAYSGNNVIDTVTTTSSIVHRLLTAAGYSAGEINVTDIAKTIDYYVKQKGTTTYWDALTQLLFEFGYVFYHNESGQFCIYDFLPASTTNSNNFNNTNMHGQLKISKKLEQYEGVWVTWWTHDTLTGAVVFSDTTGGDSQYKCNINLSADEYYPENAGTQTVYCNYKVSDRELIVVTSAAYDIVKDADIDIEQATYGINRAIIVLHNTGAGVETIYKFDITGNAVVKGELNKTERLNVAGTEKIQDFKSEYITAEADAIKLSSGLARFYKYSDFNYILVSAVNYDVGAYVTLSETKSGLNGEICRVVTREDNEYTGYSTYTLEGVEEYAADTTTTESEHTTPPPSEQTQNNNDGINNRPTYDEVIHDGWTTGTGTTVPSVPTISFCEGHFKAIVLEWDNQSNLTNPGGYDVRVSDDDTTWYDLKFDGTDWHGTGSYTHWEVETLTHNDIPLGGTADAPTGKTLYYQVRRVTKTGAYSAWSASSSATTKAIDSGELAKDSIYTNNLQAGSVETSKLATDSVTTDKIAVGAARKIYTQTLAPNIAYANDLWYDDNNTKWTHNMNIISSKGGAPASNTSWGSTYGGAPASNTSWDNTYGNIPSNVGWVTSLYEGMTAIDGGRIKTDTLKSWNYVEKTTGTKIDLATGEVDINTPDDVGRHLGIGKQGLLVKDANYTVIHDIPDAVIQEGNYYCGHIIWYQNQESYMLYYSTTPPVTLWTSVACLLDNNTNVKAGIFKVHFAVSASNSVGLSGTCFLRPKGTSWSPTYESNTPLTYLFVSNTGSNYLVNLAISQMVICPIGVDNQIEFYLSDYGDSIMLRITQMGIVI